MPRLEIFVAGLRPSPLRFAVILSLAVAGALFQPAIAGAQSATLSLSPSSGLAGSTVIASGAFFLAGDAVTIAFNGSSVRSTTAGQDGTFATFFSVPSAPVGSYHVTASGSPSGLTATASFTVSASAGAGTTLTLTKEVTVNGLGYHTTAQARPGDTLTYAIHYQNRSATPATNVTFVDRLQAGQSPLTSYLAACTFDAATRFVICTLPGIAANASGDVIIATVVDAGFSGTLFNLARVYADNVPSVVSNITQVVVGSPAGAGTQKLVICGPVSAYTGGSITVANAVIPIVAGGPPGGAPFATGTNQCITADINGAAQITALSVQPNLPGIDLVCGLVTSNTPGANSSGSVQVDGLSFTLDPTVTLIASLVSGQVYCLTLSGAGAINGILSNVPTAAFPVSASEGRFRHGRMAVD